jgi:DUF971 family protein
MKNSEFFIPDFRQEEKDLHNPIPKLVKRVSSFQTDITWSDGHFSSYPSWYLRENCFCAACVEEFTGKRKIGHGDIPSTIERVNVSPVGNYALQFSYSDGHDTGIYTFEYLRQLCPCLTCRPDGLREPPASVPKTGSFEV